MKNNCNKIVNSTIQSTRIAVIVYRKHRLQQRQHTVIVIQRNYLSDVAVT